jgi:hypothetical protein
MKKIFFAIASVMLVNQASAMTAAEFSQAFVTQANHRLTVTNQERKQEKKTPYCAKLSSAQIVLIQKTAAKPEITVGEFKNTVAENLKCYPVFWQPWERKNIGGVLLNTKAFVMDTLLVHDVLEDITGAPVVDEAPLLPEPLDFF